MLKPAFPRFLARGDKASFGSVVTSQLKKPGTAIVTMQAASIPTCCEITARETDASSRGRTAGRSALRRRREGDRHGAHPDDGAARRRERRVRGQRPGRGPGVAGNRRRLRRARAGCEGAVSATGVVPGFGGLHVELASTALVGLGEGARYMVEYPYGCAEQRASRALRCMLAADLGDAFTLPGIDPKDLAHDLADGAYASSKYQCRRRLCVLAGECSTVSPYLTSYVLHVFQRAQSSKYKVDDVGDRARVRLSRDVELAEAPPTNEGWWPAYTAWQAFAVKVLVEGGRNQDSNINAALRLPRSHAGVRACRICSTRWSRRARRRPAARRSSTGGSTNAVLPEGGSAHVEELSDPYLLWFWNSNVRSTAIVLNTLVAATAPTSTHRGDGRVADAARGRTAAGATRRRTRWRWRRSSTYYRKYEPRCRTSPATVEARRRRTRRARPSRDARTDGDDERSADGAAAGRGAGRDTQAADLRARGPARCSTRARLRYAAERRVPATARQRLPRSAQVRAIRRRRARQPAATFKAGDLVRVTLRSIYEGAALRRGHRSDARGFEPVESWFATTARTLAQEQDDQNDGRRLAGAVGARRLRPRRAPRRSGEAVRHAPEPRATTSSLRRPRDDGGNVHRRAGARRGDVRAGGVRPDRDARSIEVKR